MSKYNIDNVKSAICAIFRSKNLTMADVREKWAEFWGSPKPMNNDMIAKIATLGNYEASTDYDAVRDDLVAREIAQKVVDGMGL